MGHRQKQRWAYLACFLGLCVQGMGCHSASPAPEESAATLRPGEMLLSAADIEQMQVRTAATGFAEIGGRVQTTGRVTYNDLLVSHITSPVSGRLTEIKGQFGQAVHKGSPLAIIVSPDMGIASSDMDKAQADLNQASLELTRQKSLVAAHAAPQRDFENAEDNYDRAKSEFERASKKMRLFALEPNAAVSQSYVLRSGIDGEIISRTAFIGAEIQGQYSGGNTNDLFLVANLKEVWVMGDIHESDVGRVKASQPVSLVVEGVPNQRFVGEVNWVSDILDAATRTARVRCVVQNPNGLLKPDMFASVTIAAPGRQMLAVPRSAVVKLGDKTVVFVVGAGTQAGALRITRRPVIVDDDPRETMMPVSHGLKDGEMLVVDGADAVAKRFSSVEAQAL